MKYSPEGHAAGKNGDSRHCTLKGQFKGQLKGDNPTVSSQEREKYMSFTAICLVGMALLFKINGTSERWWIALGMILTAAAMLGFHVGMITMVLAIGCWKIIKDVFSHI